MYGVSRKYRIMDKMIANGPCWSGYIIKRYKSHATKFGGAN